MNNRDDYRWRVVQRRDASAAASFVYSVDSTRIFCRPGCAPRQPRKRNVELFLTPAEASAARYRTRQRCRLEEPVTRDCALEAVIDLRRQTNP